MLLSVEQASVVLKQGKIVAYPTEAVFGLGCCPRQELALTQLIAIKHRTISKGFILIASEVAQLLPYIDLSNIASERWQHIQRTWPGPYTWVFPATGAVLPEVRGQYSTVAVRVTAHPIAKALCDAFEGPLISTSANLHGNPPLRLAEEVISHFSYDIAGVVSGMVGGDIAPTSIQDAITGQIYR